MNYLALRIVTVAKDHGCLPVCYFLYDKNHRMYLLYKIYNKL